MSKFINDSHFKTFAKNVDNYITSEVPAETVLLNAPSFDNLVRGNGTTLVHYKGISCPIGMTDYQDDRRAHVDHSNCSNGHIYKKAGEVTVSFTNNSARNAIQNFGNIETGTVSVTIPRFYDNSQSQVYVAEYDRFYFKEDVGVIESQDVVQAHRTGLDRLQFPIVKVEFLIDADGVEYSEGDFVLDNGNIRWVGSKRPMFDAKLGKGVVFTCRYRFQPFFYVKSMVHEVRIAKQIDPATGEVVTQRMPYAVILQREISFENERNDSRSPADPRKATAPASGGFGQR